MSIKIREGRTEDFQGALMLNRNMYREARSTPDFGDFLFFNLPSKARMRKWFSGLIKDVKKNDAIYLVADADGSIAGQCFVRRDTPGSELSHVGVFSILVDKKYRNKGIGSRLLDSAIKASKGQFEILHLRVFSSNSIAKKLYKSRGFRTFGVGPRFIKRGKRYFNREYMYLRLK
jgi:ribosomal protein S18 acetylase RimI-like enzyme